MSESRSASQRLFNFNVNGDLTVSGNLSNTGTLTSTGALTTSAGIANTGTLTTTGLFTANNGFKTDGRMTNNYLFYSLFGIAAGTTVEADVVGALLTDSLTTQTIATAAAEDAAGANAITAGNSVVTTDVDGDADAFFTLPSAVADQVVVLKLGAAFDGAEKAIKITCGTGDVFETGTTVTLASITSGASVANDNILTVTVKATNCAWGAAGSHLLFYALDNATWTVRTGKTVASGNGSDTAKSVAFSQ